VDLAAFWPPASYRVGVPFRAPASVELLGHKCRLEDLLDECGREHTYDSRYDGLATWARERLRNPCFGLGLSEAARTALHPSARAEGMILVSASATSVFTALVETLCALYREESPHDFDAPSPLRPIPASGLRSRPSALAERVGFS
jgi:hypothetical protein